MKFTLSWLKEHLDTKADLATISQTLTAIGLEVEHITDNSEMLKPFIVAEIIDAKPHPDADRLRVCTVNNGTQNLQIVCGAPNARAGIKVVLAQPDTIIPTNNMKIKVSKIRGVESNGMLCSATELGLGDESDGIIELPATAEIGKAFAPFIGADDPVIEIALTPNRADCTSVHGIARDLAAAGLGKLKPLSEPKIKTSGTSPITVDINHDDCKIFTGIYIKNVKNGKSPDWLQQKLKAVGLRPISALVDITNYFTLDQARPLHVFDADKIKGNLSIQPTKGGEKLTALDDKTYTIDKGRIGIYDQSGLIGLTGIIGGTSTSCDENTKNIFLESAWFTPATIALTGQYLNIHSDARYRFERGVDPASTIPGAWCAAKMIVDLCGGEIADMVITGKDIANKHKIKFDLTLVEKHTGVKIDQKQITEILQNLNFDCDKNGTITTPSHRFDVTLPHDLVEEVIRIHGYDKIPTLTLPPVNPVQTGRDLVQKRHHIAQRLLAARGLTECVTWSFTDPKIAGLFGAQNDQLVLKNPISEDLSVMRPGLLPNLILATASNANKSNSNTRLFEIGPQFSSPAATDQPIVIAGVLSGETAPRHWTQKNQSVSALHAKAECYAVIESCGLNPDQLSIDTNNVPAWYHPGRAASLKMGKNMVAVFGEIHPGVAKKMGIKNALVGFEIFLHNLPTPKAKKTTTKSFFTPSPYQPVERDFAFIVDQNIPANDVVVAARKADKNLITRVDVFDLYEGDKIAPGKKSIAINVRLEPSQATLTDEDIQKVSNQIIDHVKKSTGGELRS